MQMPVNCDCLFVLASHLETREPNTHMAIRLQSTLFYKFLGYDLILLFNSIWPFAVLAKSVSRRTFTEEEEFDCKSANLHKSGKLKAFGFADFNWPGLTADLQEFSLKLRKYLSWLFKRIPIEPLKLIN